MPCEPELSYATSITHTYMLAGASRTVTRSPYTLEKQEQIDSLTAKGLLAYIMAFVGHSPPA